MKIEKWEPIKDTSGVYSVSTFGRVRNNKTGRMMQQQESHNGYLRVNLSVGEKRRYFPVHRLVGTAFIANPKNLPQINHKDENRKNNAVENLEWCTSSYNCSYGGRVEKLKKKIGYRVRKYTESGELICEYLSINDAVKDIGGEWHGIRDACGKNRTYHGFLWELNTNSPALNRYQRQMA